MTDKTRSEQEPKGTAAAAMRVRLPGFIKDEEIGLGDAIKRVTYVFGIRTTCGGCEQRTAVMNRWMVFTR